MLILFSCRGVCQPIFPGLPHQPTVLPQICGISRGRSSQDLHLLLRGGICYVSCMCMYVCQRTCECIIHVCVCVHVCTRTQHTIWNQFFSNVFTRLLQCIDSGKLPIWQKMPAPLISVNYWELPVSNEHDCWTDWGRVGVHSETHGSSYSSDQYY